MKASLVSLPRPVIVHERITEYGGSERVVEQMAAMWPEARLFAPIVDPAIVPMGLADTPISTSRLQALYRGGGRYAHLLPMLPLAMGRADLGDADLVLTSHHAFANRVTVPSGVPVISYTHSPARWIWNSGMRRGETFGAIGAKSLALFAATQRRADRRAASRLTGVLANSRAVAARIRRFWGRESIVVHPPVDTDAYTVDPSIDREDFFLLAGRLVPYKRPDVAVAAARAAGVRLVVAGDGRALEVCKRLAGSRTEFVGATDQDQLADLYRRCRALVLAGIEDFGIVPVEAQACGAPVLARAAGGVTDSVIPEVTGTLVEVESAGFARQVEDFATAMRRFRADEFDPDKSRANAEAFSIPSFRHALAEAVETILSGPAVPGGRRTSTPDRST